VQRGALRWAGCPHGDPSIQNRDRSARLHLVDPNSSFGRQILVHTTSVNARDFRNAPPLVALPPVFPPWGVSNCSQRTKVDLTHIVLLPPTSAILATSPRCARTRTARAENCVFVREPMWRLRTLHVRAGRRRPRPHAPPRGSMWSIGSIRRAVGVRGLSFVGVDESTRQRTRRCLYKVTLGYERLRPHGGRFYWQIACRSRDVPSFDKRTNAKLQRLQDP
jgi:hypothetical protein